MSTPTQKHTKARQRTRRAAIKATTPTLKPCPKCKKPVQSHRACLFCGTYKGNQVIKVRIPKKFRKQKKREEKKNK